MAATWTEVGNTSLLDCEALTWSLGCTSAPRCLVASVASTSSMFMLLEVPDPVWNTSTGNSASKLPSGAPATTSSAAAAIASATGRSSTPRSAFTCAAAFFTLASATTWARSSPVPLMGKFSTARCVWAR